MRSSKKLKPKSLVHRSNQGHMAELPVTIFILFIVMAMPLINLLCLVMAFAAESLMAHECATTAASQRDFDKVLSATYSVATNFVQTGFGSFAKMVPVGGYQSSGVDVYIDASNFRAVGTSQRFGPNTPVPPPIDQNTWVYECTAKASFQVGPAINMSVVPFLSDVPGLGKPATITVSASRAAEHPDGLDGAGNRIASSAGAVPTFNPTPTSSLSGPAAGPDGSGWNFPGIYEAIKAEGQVVVTQDVLQVLANNGNWTQTSVNVGPGQTVWLDTRAAGQWTVLGNSTYLTDANGYPANSTWLKPTQPSLVPSVSWASLVGKVGANQPFKVGNTLTNYAINQTGNLTLIVNDTPGSYGDNAGLQTVRVIVTRKI